MFTHPILLADAPEQILGEIAEQMTTQPQKILQGTEKMDGTQITAMTIVGLAVVFAALLILVIFLYSSGAIFKRAVKGNKPAAPAKPAAKPAPAAAVKAAPAPAPKPQTASAAASDDSEVVAVIMAAIAAMGAADGKQYRLHSVRQVTRRGSGRSLWAQAGLNDATRPF